MGDEIAIVEQHALARALGRRSLAMLRSGATMGGLWLASEVRRLDAEATGGMDHVQPETLPLTEQRAIGAVLRGLEARFEKLGRTRALEELVRIRGRLATTEAKWVRRGREWR
ncbi:MAG TPA: hypothetical protein ENK19_01615 [Acidobacteria bacterium]|nr:hypothetical protein [Acidobacteriota bacterium]